jgi:hypothetical protein
MPDGSQVARRAAPAFAEPGPPSETLLLHDGDFHDPARLPGRALRMLALTLPLHLPATPPPIAPRLQQANPRVTTSW